MLTPSRTPASGNSVSGDLPVTSIYEFVIPQHLVGRLIGRYGSYVNEIKETTHASIYIKRHPDTSKLKICAVEGTDERDPGLIKSHDALPPFPFWFFLIFFF